MVHWLIPYVSVALALGVKESSSVNNLFTIVNIGVVLFVIFAGSFKGEHYHFVATKALLLLDFLRFEETAKFFKVFSCPYIGSQEDLSGRVVLSNFEMELT